MGKTVYETVEGWTKKYWDGKRYEIFASKLLNYLIIEGVAFSYLGESASLLLKTIKEFNESVEIGLDTDETIRERLTEFVNEETFVIGAQDLEADFESLEFKVLKPEKVTA